MTYQNLVQTFLFSVDISVQVCIDGCQQYSFFYENSKLFVLFHISHTSISYLSA